MERQCKYFCSVAPKLEVTAFTCLQSISSLSIFGAKGPHKHSFWHKIEVFKIRHFCRAKYSNKLRGSSNYTGANTIKTTLLSRQGSTTYPSQLFHRSQRTILQYTEDNGRGFSNLKVTLDRKSGNLHTTSFSTRLKYTSHLECAQLTFRDA